MQNPPSEAYDQATAKPAEEAEVDLTMVVMAFEASDPERLLGVLARYVVLSRGHAGCRNIDLAMSATRHGRFLVVQKWASPAAQKAHFDSPEMIEMASACRALLASPPEIDLYTALSAHDLR